MAEIIRTFRDVMPAVRFIGKKYTDFDHWGEWFANGWFDTIEAAMGGVEAITKIWENGGGYVGLERRRDGVLTEYWIGMFAPAGTAVPETFASMDFPKTALGVCWLYGRNRRFTIPADACRPWQTTAWRRCRTARERSGPSKTVSAPGTQPRMKPSA